MRRLLALILTFLLMSLPALAQDAIEVTPIAHGLMNPRGVAVLPDGALLVVEAGIGDDQPAEAVGSGQISRFEDLNADGDYDDEGERTPLLTNIPSYNSLSLLGTFHDEVFGANDILVLEDGRVFFTRDDPFAERGPRGTEGYFGETGIFELLADGSAGMFAKRIATVNALVYTPDEELIYFTESGYNRITSISLEPEAEAQIRAQFPDGSLRQQAVPAGISYDPATGDILVALFTGFIKDYYGTLLSYMPGSARVVRVDRETGEVSDAVTGLTTAIDVAADDEGNIFTVELSTAWPTALMPQDFDLFDPNSPPDPGGYARFSGRVSMYPADGSAPVILADGIDTPTSITWHDDALYVSTGLGTPGRQVYSTRGLHRIEGILYRITGF